MVDKGHLFPFLQSAWSHIKKAESWLSSYAISELGKN